MGKPSRKDHHGYPDGAGGWRWVINLPVVTGALPDLERNSIAAADRFSGPTLFIVGGRSRYVSATDHALIVGHFLAARVETIGESGHNPHMDARSAFVALIK
jgi:pimeloyl-ACP methyl ester carboxylesterase